MIDETPFDSLRQRGIHVALDGIRLRYVVLHGADEARARTEIESQRLNIYLYVLDEMRRANLGALPPAREGWTEDAREAFEERAAIFEFEAGFDREIAEAMAEIEVRQRLHEGARP